MPQGGLETDKWVIDNVNAEGRGTGYAQFYERPQKSVTADASYFATALGGSHEVKFGGGWRNVKSSSSRVNPGEKIQARFNPTSTRARFYRDSFSETEGVYWHAYASDSFSLSRLTLDLGLRFDHQTSHKNPSQIAGNALVPDGLLSDIDFPGDSEPPVTWDTLSPRLGATLALDAERKTVARASLALYRGQLGNFEAGWTNPIRTSFVEYDWKDTNGDQVVQTPEVDFSRIRNFSNVNLDDPALAHQHVLVRPGLPREQGLPGGRRPRSRARAEPRRERRVHVPEVDRPHRHAAALGLLLVRVGGREPVRLPAGRGVLRERLLHDPAGAERRRARAGGRDRRRGADQPQGLQPHVPGARAVARQAAVEQVAGTRLVQPQRLARAPRPAASRRASAARAGSPNRTYYDSQTDGGVVASYGAGSGKVYFNNAKWQFNANLLYQLPAGFEVAGNLFGRQGYPNPIYAQRRPRRARRHVPRARRRDGDGHASACRTCGTSTCVSRRR